MHISYTVMPDSIRHPEGFNKLDSGWSLSRTGCGTGMTFCSSNYDVVYILLGDISYSKNPNQEKTDYGGYDENKPVRQ